MWKNTQVFMDNILYETNKASKELWFSFNWNSSMHIVLRRKIQIDKKKNEILDMARHWTMCKFQNTVITFNTTWEQNYL